MTTTLPPREPESAGFTLIELLIVLVLMSIVMGIAVPRMAGMVHYTMVRGAVSDIRADIAYARMEAIRSGVRTTVRFTPGSAEYRITRESRPSQVEVKRRRLGDEYKAIQMSVGSGATGDTLSFNSRGLLQNGSGGNVVIRMVRGSVRDSIMITPLGGTYRAN